MKSVTYTIFFTTKGLAIQVLIRKGKSMNARFYEKKVLRKLVTSIDDGYLWYLFVT